MTDRLKCPKCACVSGDNWLQCGKRCPMPMSPYFDEKHPLAAKARDRLREAGLIR
jgi:hypothetical protein